MLIILSLFLLIQGHLVFSTSGSDQLAEFLALVVEKSFKNCDILIAKHSSGSEDPFNFHHKFLRTLLHQVPTASIYSLSLDSDKKPIRQGSVHRLGNHCMLSVNLLLHKNVEEGIKRFSSLITWRYGVITWKDMDHYIFVTRKVEVDQVALSPITTKIKYKIVFGIEDGKSWDGLIKSACFYCNNGLPTVITKKLVSKSVPELHQIFPDYVVNFNGFKIRAAVSSKIKYRIEIYEKQGKWHGKPGVHTKLIQLCQRKFNFTYELFPSIGGGGSGVKWPNGTWTGSMADILYGNAEFGMVTAQTLQRDELVSFSFPITYDWLTFATGRPRQINTWKKIFWPLSPTVWYCLVPTLVAVIVGWYVISKLAHALERYVLDFGLTIWYMIAPLLEQDFHYPTTQGLRCFCIVWLFFALLMSTAYRSELVPSLAFPYVQMPPQTFEQLTSSNYRWGLYYLAGAAYSAFRSSTNPTYVKLFKGMEIENDAVHCLIRAIETRFACIIYEGSAVDVVHRSLSDKHGRHPINVAPTTTFFISSCWVMEKRAIFRPNFERLMHQTMDMGVNMRWVEMNYRRIREERRENVNRTQYTFTDAKDGPQPLELVTFTGPFFVLIFGILVASAQFSMEIVILKLKRKLPLVMRYVRKIVLRITGTYLQEQQSHDYNTVETIKTLGENYPSLSARYGIDDQRRYATSVGIENEVPWKKLKNIQGLLTPGGPSVA